MSASLALPVDAIRAGLNEDPEFVLAARYWYCDLRFVVGDDFYFMHIEDGVVTDFTRGTQGFDPYSINIGGPVEVWEQMMPERPKPFYHDWFAASFHHDFDISGDLASAYAYYFAIRRMHAVIARSVRALEQAA
ncbi:MAG: hypothetical protein ACU85V_02255 [Gammaproteobacteria bacterium]